MLWGRGDTSQLDEHEKVVLASLRRMVETGHIVALDADQSETLIRALDLYDRWESALGLIGSIRNIALLAAGGITFWWATGGENFISDLVRKLVGSP